MAKIGLLGKSIQELGISNWELGAKAYNIKIVQQAMAYT